MKRLLCVAALALASCTPVGPAPEELEDLRAKLDAIQKEQRETRAAVERVEKRLSELTEVKAPLRPPRRRHGLDASQEPSPPFEKCALIPEQIEVTLPSKEVDDALADLGGLSKAARIIPSFRDGAPEGFKIFGLRPGTLLERAGLRNGDLIHTVNDLAITSPDRALHAYEKVKGAKELALLISRQGERRCLNLKLSP